MWASTIVALLAMALVYIVTVEDMMLQYDIQVISQDTTVEKHLKPYEELLGADYTGYRNHIYRVLTYSLHYLHGDEKHRETIAMALVYHDIGLWTDKTNAYLKPSIDRAVEKVSNEDVELVQNIIYYHHKVTPFHGKNERIVNAVRKADWIDATMGYVHFSMPRRHMKTVNDAISEAGFHMTLAEYAQGKRVHFGDSWKALHPFSSGELEQEDVK
ncbi:unnamed protein product [Aphanomyces euteiches]